MHRKDHTLFFFTSFLLSRQFLARIMGGEKLGQVHVPIAINPRQVQGNTENVSRMDPSPTVQLGNQKKLQIFVFEREREREKREVGEGMTAYSRYNVRDNRM